MRICGLKKDLLAAVAETAFGVVGFVFCEEPETDRDLRVVKAHAGEGGSEGRIEDTGTLEFEIRCSNFA